MTETEQVQDDGQDGQEGGGEGGGGSRTLGLERWVQFSFFASAVLLFWLFGENMLVTRFAAIAMNISSLLCLFWIGRRMLRPHWAALTPLLYIALLVVGFPWAASA